MEGNHPLYIMRDSAIHQFFRVAEYHTYRKLWDRMRAAQTFTNSTEEGHGTARRVQNAVFMAEKHSAEYAIIQKPCDLRTCIGIYSKLSQKHFALKMKGKVRLVAASYHGQRSPDTITSKAV